MARIILEPIRKRCPRCRVLIEFDENDYDINDIGHGRPDGFCCPSCGTSIPVRLSELPKAWKDHVLAKYPDL